jgi:lysozyme family protein
MADFNQIWPFVFKWETPQYVNNPHDKGGPTKYGVTLATWLTYGYDKDGDGAITAHDVMLLTEEDAKRIAKLKFWDYFKADNINNQAIANIIFDWGWASGPVTAARQMQKLLNLTPDGVFGSVTVSAVNKENPETLFAKIKQARIDFANNIVKNNPTQQKWIAGWINRINAISGPTKKK